MHRRSFLTTSSAALTGTFLSARSCSACAEDSYDVATEHREKHRVGIIGATGHGGYGHALDAIWQSVPGAQIVAVADSDAKGREAAGKRLAVSSLYDDYRQMLAHEKPDIVTVAPRWLDQREAMVKAAAAAGCHILCEKPLAIDAASADRILAACRSANVKIAVAHTQRAASGVAELRARLADGRLGKILRMNARGKEDHRAGGEDLAVLGCHMFDLMNLLAGPPRWVSAEVLQNGHAVTRGDARQASEPIGPIAGDCISSSYGFEGGIHGAFESKSAARESGVGKRHSLEIICTKGIALICPETAEQFWLPEPAITPSKPQSWEQLGSPQWLAMKTAERFAWCKVQIAQDLLQAIAEDREPLAGGTAASVAVEMVQSVYSAHLSGGRISLPLVNRRHPLS